MRPFLAMIMPVGEGPVDPGWTGGVAPGGGQGGGPGIWPGPRPSHPIMLPGMPGWGSGGAGGGGSPPYPDQGLPGGQPYPDQGLPGSQPRPTHPIYIPAPPTEPPQPPLVIWGGPYFPPEPTHPIVLPPEVAPPETPDGRPIEWKVAWTPATGWIVVGVPTGEHPTPSKK